MERAKRRLRIGHVANTDFFVWFLLLDQLQALASRGYEVEVVCADGPLVMEVRRAGFRVIPWVNERRITPFRDIRSLRRLVSVFKSRRYDIVHTHNPKVNVLAPIAARLARVPITVSTVHGYFVDDGSAWTRKFLYYALERRLGRLLDRIFFQSAEDLALARWLGIKDAGSLIGIGNGVDLERFCPDPLRPEERRRIDRQLGIPEGWKVVGMVGRLVEEKGIRDFLEAAAMLLERLGKVVFLLIGPSEKGKRPDAIDPAGVVKGALRDSVRILGVRRDLETVLRRLDLLVLPSYREGFPRSLIEAAASGLPAVASDIRGCREAVEDGVTGFLVPAGDALALANAAARVLTNHDLAFAMSRATRRRAERLFSAERIHDRIAEEYLVLAEMLAIRRGRAVA